jgi:hypothetical protein
MTPHAPQDWDKVASIAQTMALVITVACVFMGVGELRAQIGSSAASIMELRDVSSDLLKAQVTTTSNDVQYLEILNELRRRVDALERHVRQ